MNLSKAALSVGIVTLSLGAILPDEANAQRIVRAAYNGSTNNSAQGDRPLGVDFEITDAGLIEDFSYTIEDEGNLITLIEDATGQLVDTSFVSDVFSFEFSLLGVDVKNAPVSSTDISLLFRFDNVSSFFSGLPESPTAQNILDFLVVGDSILNDNLVTDEDDSDFSTIMFSSKELGDDGIDPFNDDIQITVLETENAQVPEPGTTLGLFAFGALGVRSLRKKQRSMV